MDDKTKNFKKNVGVASAIIGFFVGMIGIKGFFSGNPEDFIYFFFFTFLFYLRAIDKRLSYLGILGIIGAVFAILAINEIILI